VFAGSALAARNPVENRWRVKAMTDDARLREQLLAKIEKRRADVNAFLHDTRPRRNRMTNVSIVSSAMAAIFTAGPAIGGLAFAQAVEKGLALTQSAVVWRTLCAGALIVSLVAAISTNLSKSQDLASRVTAAEVCNIELEGLRAFVEFRDLSVGEAVELYQQYVTKIPFVEEAPRVPP
jgi:hypothetical protein